MAMASEEHQPPEQNFNVELKQGEDIGVQLTKDLQIQAIRDDGPFSNKCTVGDQIVQVNDIPVRDIDDFNTQVEKHAPFLRIQIARGLRTTEEHLLPPEREKNVQRRDGFSYHIAKIDYVKGCKFGLGIKHFQNRVLVSRVDEGSLSAKSLCFGDRIIDINGDPVTDKDVARNMLLRSLQKLHTVSLVVERAVNSEAKESVKTALMASQMQPPSVAMASDVQGIIQRQKQKMAQPAPARQKGSIMRKGASKGGSKVVIAEKHKEHVIATDNEGKALKHVGQK